MVGIRGPKLSEMRQRKALANSYGGLQEHSLFASIKEWSKGPAAATGAGEREQQLLALVNQVRLECIPPEQLHALIDDPWMQKVSLPLWSSAQTRYLRDP